MRVLLVAPYFYPEGGGLERYAYKMAKELSEEMRWLSYAQQNYMKELKKLAILK